MGDRADGDFKKEELKSETEEVAALAFEDFKPGTVIYVRGDRSICYALDFPLVYFAGSKFEASSSSGGSDVEALLDELKIRHRSFVADPELFSRGPDFGLKVELLPLGNANGLVGGQHLGMPQVSNAAKNAAQSLLGGTFFGGGSTLGGGSLSDFGIDDDKDDDEVGDDFGGFHFASDTVQDLEEEIEKLDAVTLEEDEGN